MMMASEVVGHGGERGNQSSYRSAEFTKFILKRIEAEALEKRHKTN